MNKLIGKDIRLAFEDNLFAFVVEGMVVEENISMERIMELVESFNVPEYSGYTIQFWDVSLPRPSWVIIC